MDLLRAILQFVGRVSCEACGKSYWWFQDHSCEDAIADPQVAVIGSYADYFDTGVWSLNKETGEFEPPTDLSPEQARDSELAFGIKSRKAS